jgi:hypothetical protein
MTMQAIPVSDERTLGDYRLYAGALFQLTGAACHWAKGYQPTRVIQRLRDLKAGGHATTLREAARRVAWPCPRCAACQWRGGFAYPHDISDREIRRQTRHHRD